MKHSAKYDIFISYRRQGGEATAKMLFDSLSDMGYRVFLDVETLRSGAFNTKLYEVIDSCQDVLVILAPDSLDRCANEDDWVRLEIARALSGGKNIVPILLRGFQFPEELPADIDALRYCSGLTANTEFYSAFLKRLREFLKSRPAPVRLMKFNASWRRTAAVLGVLALFSLAGLGVSQIWRQKFPDQYPATQAEKNTVERMLGNLGINCTLAEMIFEEEERVFNSFDDYLKGGMEYGALCDQIGHCVLQIDKSRKELTPPPQDLTDDLKKSSISLADYEVADQLVDMCARDAIDAFERMKESLGPDSPLAAPEKETILKTEKDTFIWEVDAFIAGVYEVVFPISEEALAPFRKDVLASLFTINRLKTVQWPHSQSDLDSANEELNNRSKRITDELVAMTGENYIRLAELKSEQQHQLDHALEVMTATGLTRDAAIRKLNDFISQGFLIDEVVSIFEEGGLVVNEAEDKKARAEFEGLLLRAGYSRQEIEELFASIKESGLPVHAFYTTMKDRYTSLAEKNGRLMEANAELHDEQQILEEGQKKIREKGNPELTDDENTAIGKILYFMSARMYGDALDNCRFMLDRGLGTPILFETISTYLSDIGRTGIDYGALVAQADSGPIHKGDIILAADGVLCRSYDELMNQKDGENSAHTFHFEGLRLENGELQPFTAEITGTGWGLGMYFLYPEIWLDVPEDLSKKRIYEDCLPFDDDTKDELLDKGLRLLDAGLWNEGQRVLQECLYRFGPDDPDTDISVRTMIRMLRSLYDVGASSGIVILQAPEDQPFLAGDIIIMQNGAYCEDISSLYRQVRGSGQTYRFVVLRMNEDGDLIQVKIDSDERVKECEMIDIHIG